MQQELKQDPVDRKKLSLLERSSDDALPLIARLFTDYAQDAGSELVKRIDAISAELGGVDDAAAHARERVAAAMAGEELTVSDLQLVSALSSAKAASDTRDLRASGLVDAAFADVKRATGSLPDATVLVMADETRLIGVGGRDRGSYMSDVGIITVEPGVTPHTLRHEVVHASQPPPPESGPAFFRREMIEGTTDALALAAGSDPDELSYKPQTAAVLGVADALSRSREGLAARAELDADPGGHDGNGDERRRDDCVRHLLRRAGRSRRIRSRAR